MKLFAVDTGYFKLDGGAMFGVVPKTMWKKINPPDENNLCTWAMRCLLVEDGDQLILIDCGMGDKQDDKFKSHFQPHGDATLISSINSLGYQAEEITDVFISHFHFDHVGGAVSKSPDGQLYLNFPNARYWTNRKHFEWSLEPNFREKASFLKENFIPLYEAKKLNFIDNEDGVHFNENITVKFFNGHTEALMVPYIKTPDGKTIVYPSDLLPSSGHVRMPYVMAYDIRPLITLEEKGRFYEEILNDDVYIFFEHDKDNMFGQLNVNERGRYSIITKGLDQIIENQNQ